MQKFDAIHFKPESSQIKGYSMFFPTTTSVLTYVTDASKIGMEEYPNEFAVPGVGVFRKETATTDADDNILEVKYSRDPSTKAIIKNA